MLFNLEVLIFYLELYSNKLKYQLFDFYFFNLVYVQELLMRYFCIYIIKIWDDKK